MERIRPDRDMCADAAARCIAGLASGALEFIKAAGNAGWLPVVITESPAELAEPVVRALGAGHCEAPALIFDDDGSYAGAACGYPTTGSYEMAGVVMDWRRSFVPERVMMIGDCAADEDCRNVVDVFVGYGGLSGSMDISDGFDYRIEGFSDQSVWNHVLSSGHGASGSI